jgi:hypothetical protein
LVAGEAADYLGRMPEQGDLTVESRLSLGFIVKYYVQGLKWRARHYETCTL